jgi:hypothetical protein
MLEEPAAFCGEALQTKRAVNQRPHQDVEYCLIAFVRIVVYLRFCERIANKRIGKGWLFHIAISNAIPDCKSEKVKTFRDCYKPPVGSCASPHRINMLRISTSTEAQFSIGLAIGAYI